MLIVVWYLVPGLFLFGIVGAKASSKSSWYTFFKSSLQKVTFCPDLLRSTFVAEKLLLLCRILPRPVIPEMVVPIKSPVPFLQKPISYYSYFTITGRSPQPLCYFLVRK